MGATNSASSAALVRASYGTHERVSKYAQLGGAGADIDYKGARSGGLEKIVTTTRLRVPCFSSLFAVFAAHFR